MTEGRSVCNKIALFEYLFFILSFFSIALLFRWHLTDYFVSLIVVLNFFSVYWNVLNSFAFENSRCHFLIVFSFLIVRNMRLRVFKYERSSIFKNWNSLFKYILSAMLSIGLLCMWNNNSICLFHPFIFQHPASHWTLHCKFPISPESSKKSPKFTFSYIAAMLSLFNANFGLLF